MSPQSCERVPPFWQCLSRYHDAISLIDVASGRYWSYEELENELDQVSEFFFGIRERQVVLLPLDNKIDHIVTYLAALNSGHVPLLYSEGTSRAGLADLILRHEPGIVIGSATALVDQKLYKATGNHRIVVRAETRRRDIYSGLALMVSTSGSSGSSKVVRLSTNNINANAAQIVKALHIRSGDRAVTSLPLSYVYGLSILHSHLLAGAAVVISARSVVEPEFWRNLREYGVSSLGGVPWTYQTMKKCSVEQVIPKCLKKMTAAGGRLDAKTSNWMVDAFGDDRSLYFMYGQTEATARISVLPPTMVRQKLGSVGYAVSGGSLTCDPDGTIYFSGPNVMLGYADSWRDWARGDELQGRVDTGDVGYIDEDGCLFISGRKRRICKIYGVRLNLDEISSFAEALGLSVSANQVAPDRVDIRCVSRKMEEIESLPDLLGSRFGVPSRAFAVERIALLPRLNNGKICN